MTVRIDRIIFQMQSVWDSQHLNTLPVCLGKDLMSLFRTDIKIANDRLNRNYHWLSLISSRYGHWWVVIAAPRGPLNLIGLLNPPLFNPPFLLLLKPLLLNHSSSTHSSSNQPSSFHHASHHSYEQSCDKPFLYNNPTNKPNQQPRHHINPPKPI